MFQVNTPHVCQIKKSLFLFVMKQIILLRLQERLGRMFKVGYPPLFAKFGKFLFLIVMKQIIL